MEKPSSQNSSAKPLRVDEVYCFIARNKDGDEGIPAIQLGNLMMPMVGADMDRVLSLMGFAKTMAKEGSVTIELVKFSNRTHVETIRADDAPD